MADEHLHNTIEKYLLGELPPAESARLEADMAADPALFEQVEIQRLGLMGMRRLAAADMREKFAKWDEDLDAPPPSSSPPANRNFWIWATITLLLLLTAGAFWHFWQAEKWREMQERERQEIVKRDSLIAVLRADYQQKTEELAALLEKSGSRKDSLSMLKIKHLQEELDRKEKALRDLEGRRSARNPQIAMQFAPPSNTATRGRGESADPTLAAAQKAYDTRDFTEAVRLLKSIPPNDPRQEQVVQMLPYALFYAGRFQQAIPEFLNLWEKDDFEAMNAQGYLLLCYIAEGKTLEARQLRLNILRDPNPKFHQMANELKGVLNVE